MKKRMCLGFSCEDLKINFQENATYSVWWFLTREKERFPGLSSCCSYFHRCPMLFLSSSLDSKTVTSKIWFSIPCIENHVILTKVGSSRVSSESWLPWNDRFTFQQHSPVSSNLSSLNGRGWDFRKEYTLLLELLWHFMKAIGSLLPRKDSLPQTIYVVSICALIGNCLG